MEKIGGCNWTPNPKNLTNNQRPPASTGLQSTWSRPCGSVCSQGGHEPINGWAACPDSSSPGGVLLYCYMPKQQRVFLKEKRLKCNSALKSDEEAHAGRSENGVGSSQEKKPYVYR